MSVCTTKLSKQTLLIGRWYCSLGFPPTSHPLKPAVVNYAIVAVMVMVVPYMPRSDLEAFAGWITYPSDKLEAASAAALAANGAQCCFARWRLVKAAV